MVDGKVPRRKLVTNLIVGRDATLLALFTDLFAETHKKETPVKGPGVDCSLRLSDEVAIAFLVAVVVLIAFVYVINKLASCSGAEQL